MKESRRSRQHQQRRNLSLRAKGKELLLRQALLEYVQGHDIVAPGNPFDQPVSHTARLVLKKKVLKALAEGATVACPRCGTHTEKNDACMHMTCACGASFCYCCGRPSSRGGVPIDPPPRDGRGGSLCPRNPGGGEVRFNLILIRF